MQSFQTPAVKVVHQSGTCTKHIILVVREADVHIKADKVVHRLQLTVRLQNLSTFGYVKGASPAHGEVAQEALLSLSVRSEETRERGFVRPERSHKGECASPRPPGVGGKRKELCPPGAKSHRD